MNIEKYPLNVVFHKFGEMIYFSQLDIMHLLEKSLRRSKLPVYFTQGFNPHIKISFKSGLKLGIKGQIEVTLYFLEKVSLEDFKLAISSHLPDGLDIIP